MIDICSKQVQAYVDRIQPDGHVIGGFGRATKDAFDKLRKGVSYLDSGSFPGVGTGPCMKMAPLGLYMHATGLYNDVLRKTKLIGRATHLDERAVTTGVVQAHAINSLLDNPTKKEFLESLFECSRFYERENAHDDSEEVEETLTSKLNWVVQNQNVDDEVAKKELGCSSLAISAYPFTIFMFQKYWDRPLEGLVETVNFGGDCDTTGAMYGALAGAKNGMIFPEDWKLNEKARLAELGEKIWRLG